ncbi:RNA polymerase sigma factor [Actinacidiphila sp. bgisy160]|uniref:RNA polymerase sigma factor n=1 Tax=Actinacidiphila sp. bgisy160 TaxID=3413796 RepID=UPI003D73AA5B
MSRTSTTKAGKAIGKRRRPRQAKASGAAQAGNAAQDRQAARTVALGPSDVPAEQVAPTEAGGPHAPAPPSPSASAPPGGRAAPEPKAQDPAAEAVRIAKAAQAAFDGLYTRNAPALLRQVELLTGNMELARHAVHRAFDLAWQRWPEVAVDPDPAGWIRAEAHHHALAPWQQLLPWFRTPPRERSAFQRLPRGTRHAVLLHDGLGLSLRRTAAESMATTSMTRRRIVRGREALGEGAAARLGDLLDEQPQPEYPAAMVRELSEQWLRIRTVGAVAATVVIALVTAVGLVFGPLSDRVAADHDPVGQGTSAPAP